MSGALFPLCSFLFNVEVVVLLTPTLVSNELSVRKLSPHAHFVVAMKLALTTWYGNVMQDITLFHGICLALANRLCWPLGSDVDSDRAMVRLFCQMRKTCLYHRWIAPKCFDAYLCKWSPFRGFMLNTGGHPLSEMVTFVKLNYYFPEKPLTLLCSHVD